MAYRKVIAKQDSEASGGSLPYFQGNTIKMLLLHLTGHVTRKLFSTDKDFYRPAPA